MVAHVVVKLLFRVISSRKLNYIINSYLVAKEEWPYFDQIFYLSTINLFLRSNFFPSFYLELKTKI